MNEGIIGSQNKPKVLDVFSGAGGFSLGFEMAGCEIIGAIERDKWAADTFSYNHKEAAMLLGNIEDLEEDDIKEKLKVCPDIIIGGPPCQGFSVCVNSAGDSRDPRNALFQEFLRMGKIYHPKIMVMENVPNIMKASTASGEKVIGVIKNELENLGYFVYHKILSASDFGVPQMRQRFVLIASKVGLVRPFPKPTHFIADNSMEYGQISLFHQEYGNLQACPTLWDAISDLPEIEAREGAECMEYTQMPINDYQRWCRVNNTKLYNHLAMKHTKRLVERFGQMTWGQSVSDIKDERFKQRKRNGNGEVSESPYDQNNRRMHPNKICHTITAAFYGNFVHPYKNRNFTAREGARIQSFPDYYVFLGKPTVVSKKLLEKEGRWKESYLCQYSQIGNAVPPLMARAIAANIMEQINFQENEDEQICTWR